MKTSGEVMCKKTWLDPYDKLCFLTGELYNIKGIIFENIIYIEPKKGYVISFKLVDFKRGDHFTDYFYTKEEYRKIKIQKILE